ncbi:hypothetical protein HAX54_017404 [Datura stramonium]|uniref:NADH:quinone oxidoreductase/Mrp antiporter transmembrane domain-containing protein n=1 Tax=Datura stramonium TaxID=4076 RepID=A0ABS8UMX0_DATST|nr:hypothetical protein [Datura stramonium]
MVAGSRKKEKQNREVQLLNPPNSLPDVMEGSTPISTLVHAATMVATGIFLVTRLRPLFRVISYTVGKSIGLRMSLNAQQRRESRRSVPSHFPRRVYEELHSGEDSSP